jgi:hypothetical protein
MSARKHLTRLALLPIPLILTSAASAQVLTTDPSLPPVTGAYVATGPAAAVYAGPGLTITLQNVTDTNFSNIQHVTSGANELETFNSSATGDISFNGGPLVPVTLAGPVETETFGKTGMTTGTFNTQMLSLDLIGNAAGHSAELMLDPTQTTAGQTTVADVGGGNFQITSFFDVFTELSLDSGPFIPQNNGPSLLTLQNMPEPSGVALLACAGLAVLRRRSRSRM